ncbi:MAG TPA: sigma 54-interacting transcriptional regulator [Blastocatellia bacterium]|nr:sigma 54-interacting transcriptional regulator [Blastocatellia bacterium]
MRQKSPKLIALTGPLKGETYELNVNEFYIGRDPSNQISVNDHLVSRLHAVIKIIADRIDLSDLNSSNGTMVNNVPVKQRRLEHCDQIAIGNSQFLLLLHEEEARPPSVPARLDDGETTIGVTATTQPRSDDALYLHMEKALAAAAHSEGAASDIGALLRISLVISQIREVKALLRRLLELIFELIPAEQGAILLVDDAPGADILSASLDRTSGPDHEMRLSRTVVERVRTERVVILSDDVLESDPVGPTPSLVASNIRSLLAAPLAVFDQAIGVIYLITRDPKIHFNRGHQELLAAISALAAAKLENVRRLERLEEELRRQREGMREMIGESKPMRRIGRLILKVAPNDATVLIRGESGTGKEMVARAIHRHSLRASKPFVAVNCAALQEGLFESELFGHERGAFTGAVAQKRGLLEIADGGAIFLDEVGELPLTLQAKLLRALQEREFLRVGGTRPVKVNVRVIAATNRDLEALSNEGRFREDLYYRLNVLPVTLPPLRERREDIILLARYFLGQFGKACKRPVRGLTQSAINCLLRYEWPGNVRELSNAIERAVTLCEGEFIHPFDLPEAIGAMEAPPETARLHLPTAVKETKQRLILQSVEQAQGNLTTAAKLLGVDAANLHRLIRDLELKPETEKLIRSFKSKPDPRP